MFSKDKIESVEELTFFFIIGNVFDIFTYERIIQIIDPLTV